MGNNRAAQLHVQAAIEGCYSGHWDRWGLKPNHRYTLTGGTGADGENMSGSSYCTQTSDNYATIRSMEDEVRKTVQGWMDSPGHRRALLDPAYTILNVGIANDGYSTTMAQHFSSDYVRYSQRPTISNDGTLTFSAKVARATLDIGNSVNVQIAYDRTPKPLTAGQLAYTYALCNPTPVAYVVKPLPEGHYYTDDGTQQQTVQRKCVDPYLTPSSRAAPASSEESHQAWAAAKSASANAPDITITTSRVIAEAMTVSANSITVKADLSRILDHYGAGIYTVLLWGRPNRHVGPYASFETGRILENQTTVRGTLLKIVVEQPRRRPPAHITVPRAPEAHRQMSTSTAGRPLRSPSARTEACPRRLPVTFHQPPWPKPKPCSDLAAS